MPTVVLLIGSLVSLGLTILLARTPAASVQRRRDRPERLLRDVAVIFGIALFFPLWDHVLIETAGLPLAPLWTPRSTLTVGAVTLILLPWLMALWRRGRIGGMGWGLPQRGGVALGVIVVGAILGVFPFLFGVSIPPASSFDLLLSLLTIVSLDEILFRGAIQSRLEVVLAGAWPWLLTGLLYGLWYMPALVFGVQDTPDPSLGYRLALLLWQTSFGWLLAVARHVTGSLVPGLLAHYLFLSLSPWLLYFLGR